MTQGVGTLTAEQALNSFDDMTVDLEPIQLSEYQARIKKAQAIMQANGIDAMYVNAGTNLTYFTGLQWYASERLVGAIVPAQGEVTLIAPAFEVGSLTQAMVVPLNTLLWDEHESPYDHFVQFLQTQALIYLAMPWI